MFRKTVFLAQNQFLAQIQSSVVSSDKNLLFRDIS